MATLVDSPEVQRSSPNWTVTGLLAVVPFVATLISTAKGPGLSPDSVNYLSTGINLAEGQGLTTFSGETLTVFPPGLPVLIAAGEVVGVGANWTSRLVTAASFSAIVVLGAVLLARHVANRRLATGATAFIAVSVALLAVANMAWTEAPFIVVTLAFILLLERALAEPQRWWWVVACAGVVWLAFMLRYAGISLVAVGGATLLVGLRQVNRVVAVRNAAVFGVLAVVGPVGWMLRNRSVDETLMGPRSPSTDTPVQVAYRIARTVGEWVAPLPVPGPLLGLVGVALLGGILAGFVVVWQTGRNADVYSQMPLASLLPTVVFGTGYTAYLVLAQLTTAFDGINSRLLSPIFVPLVIVAAVVLDRLASITPQRLRFIVGVAIVGIIGVQALSFVNDTAQAARSGRGYSGAEWQQSELAAAVADLPGSAAVYASQPDAIWAATGRGLVSMSPRMRALSSTNELVEIPPDFITASNCGQAYLALFDANTRKYLRTPEQLAEVVTLTPVAEYPDGTLYRLGPLADAGCDTTATG